MSRDESKRIEIVIQPQDIKKNKAVKLQVSDADTVGSVLHTLRTEHDVPHKQFLLLTKRELKPERTLRSYLIGTEVGGNELHLSSLERRDKLILIQENVQKLWDDHKVFEMDAPDDENTPKYMITFPYPYMNGLLHVGHGFSLSKAEFTAGYQRLKGKHVLFPFAFHCTGMPIAACAKKLEREMNQFGNPPIFPPPKVEEQKEEKPEKKGKKGKKKKGKAAKKKSKKLYQWQIMQEMGVPEEEIQEFSDPLKWLQYFPPRGKDHLKKFGLKSDFRRSFITTSQNPYYDSFIRWQFDILQKRDYIKFGNRASVYSPIDSQPCADHDRASGEQVGPQEYTLIKMKIIHEETPYTKVHNDKLSEYKDHDIYLVPATLRPETMYGQTNCWVFPNGDYVVLNVTNKTNKDKPAVYICSKHSARNMCYQEIVPNWGEMEILREIKGWDLLGRKCTAPNCDNDFVFVLPLLTIKMNKGTGIVTSVPSDSPDDYIALADIQNDAEFRAKYYVTEEMVKYDVIPIIQTGTIDNVEGEGYDFGSVDFGNIAAKKACEIFEVKTQTDAKKLAAAKEVVYNAGFYKGIMDVGPHKGETVQNAKAIIRKELIDGGEADVYFEPESQVISRSGDTCVVAFVDQWYLRYGHDKQEWMDRIMNHVENTLECYNPDAKTQFIYAVNWLQQWACSRQFGLGTNLPFDEQFVIESLSDSTIYMAYYTVAHFLQQGVLDGHNLESSVGYIDPKALTNEFWDSVFITGRYPKDCEVRRDVWDNMRKEFEFWYPLDLRVSGKDLIGNHLTMSLYNHAAIWEDRDMLPKSFFTNGHSLIDGEKMSKSTGNFLTLIDCVEQFSADATRFSLADAGDGLDDANFSGETCHAAILKLTREEKWIIENHNEIQPQPQAPMLKQKLEDLERECAESYEAENYIRAGQLQSQINQVRSQILNISRNPNAQIEPTGNFREGPIELFVDQLFQNEINRAVIFSDEAYGKMQFRNALRYCFHDFIRARNFYIDVCGDIGLHKDLIMRYIDVLLITFSPICPHFCEYVWQQIGKPGFVIDASYPAADPEDLILTRKNKYIFHNSHALRTGLKDATKQRKGKRKGKGKAKQTIPQHPIDSAYIYVSREYPQNKKAVIQLLAEEYKSTDIDLISPNADPDAKAKAKEVKNAIRQKIAGSETLKPDMSKLMQFAQFLQNEMETRGRDALELSTPFDELSLARDNVNLITRGSDLTHVEVFDAADDSAPDPKRKREKAVPGKFEVYFFSSQD